MVAKPLVFSNCCGDEKIDGLKETKDAKDKLAQKMGYRGGGG